MAKNTPGNKKRTTAKKSPAKRKTAPKPTDPTPAQEPVVTTAPVEPEIPQPSGNPTRKRLLLTALGFCIVVAAGLAAFLLLKPEPVIPKSISDQVSFAVFYPDPDQGYKLDRSSFRYDSTTKVLTFTAEQAGATSVVFSEQATPEAFVDIPQAYDKLINSLRPYSSFDSLSGKVSLTRPEELQGGQSAVLNGKGTLLFVRPSNSLGDDEWRRLFNNLKIAS